MRHKHDIAPNHTDGEPDRPTDMDVDDVYNNNKKKTHDLSDADAMTQHIYSCCSLWERRHRSLEPWWGCQSWRQELDHSMLETGVSISKKRILYF